MNPGARRPDGKVRGARISAIFECRATQPASGSPTRQPRWGGGGMPRPGIMLRTMRSRTPVSRIERGWCKGGSVWSSLGGPVWDNRLMWWSSCIFWVLTAWSAGLSAQATDPAGLIKEARKLNTEGKQDEALALYRDALRRAPDSFDAHLGAGVALDLKG